MDLFIFFKILKNKNRVFLFGKMVENIWDNGLKENKMVLELIHF
jgi:hypothetical protein